MLSATSNISELATTMPPPPLVYNNQPTNPVPINLAPQLSAAYLTSAVDDEELKRLIMHQLEFYFSRENLLHDKYLLSQMDNDQYVPISILVAFNMMRKQFSRSPRFEQQQQSVDERVRFVAATVSEYAAAQLTQLQLDPTQTKMRAQHKRSVVIVREIDKDTPLEVITGLFDKCQAKCVQCEFAGNRSWYLTFRDELEAQIAVQHLKEEVQTFNGEALYARIKTLPMPRVSLPNSQAKNNDINNNNGGNKSDSDQPSSSADYDAVDEFSVNTITSTNNSATASNAAGQVPISNSSQHQSQVSAPTHSNLPPSQPAYATSPAYNASVTVNPAQTPAAFNTQSGDASFKYYPYYTQSKLFLFFFFYSQI